MALISPGVQITVIDQTTGTPSPAGSIPMLFIATVQDKAINRLDSSGIVTVADATRKQNAHKVYFISSRTELLNLFGDPVYDVQQGSVVMDSELHEFGLLTAYKLLGQTNGMYIVRADVDLAQLQPSSTEPTVDPANNTWWLDTTATKWGIFESDGNPVPGFAFKEKIPLIYYKDDDADTVFRSSVEFDPTLGVGVAGNLTINGINVPVIAADTPDQVAQNITTAGIQDVKAYAVRLHGRAILHIVHTGGGTITVSADPGLGFTTPTAGTTYKAPHYEDGDAGDYAVLANYTDVPYFQKIRPQGRFAETDPAAIDWWFQIGGADWKRATPTAVYGASAFTAVGAGDSMSVSDNVNTVNVVFTGAEASLNDLVTAINGAIAAAAPNDPKVEAAVIAGQIVLSNYEGGDLVVADVAGTPAFDHGLDGTFLGNRLFYQPHYSVPSSSVAGDVWIKTTEPGNGADFVVKKFDSTTSTWSTVDAPFYANDDAAIGVLGNTIAANTLFVWYNYAGTSSAPLASHVIRTWNGQPTVTATGTTTPNYNGNPPTTPGDQFVLIVGDDSGVQTPYLVTLTGVDAADAAFVINNLAITGMDASVDGEKHLVLQNTDGHTFTLSYVDPVTLTDYSLTNTGNPIVELGFVPDTTFTNWSDLVYEPSPTEVTAEATEGTLWYDDRFRADIMVNDGDQWRGYLNQYPTTDPNGPILSSAEPTTQSDGTPLVDNDLWIDTSDLENYPKIYRYRVGTGIWEAIDTTDQTTPFGIVFADARPNADGQVDGSELMADMLVSDFVDPDAPDPRVYPAGILLFNTRYSGRVVRIKREKYFQSYVGVQESPGIQYSVGASTFVTDTITTANMARWVNESGNRVDGRMYAGRHAQRRVIVKRLQAAAAVEEARSDFIEFNLIAAPGYPELADDLVLLNRDRGEAAFIVIDSPSRLAPTVQELQAWATNANNAASTGEEGLTTFSPYVAAYYPWGLSTDTFGNEVPIPASAMGLEAMLRTDRDAAPWYAPAGTSRGVVTIASSVGYIDSEGEFANVRLTEDLRDILYQNKVNPIPFLPGTGIVVFGQKTLNNASPSALDRINVARLIVALRRLFQRLARPFLFEINDAITRSIVKRAFERRLESFVDGRALQDFVVVCDESNNTPDRIDRNELWIDVAVQPTRAIEFIYIPIRVVDTGVDLR